MSAPRPAASRALAAGVVLVLVGLACWILHGVASGRERHSYASGGAPPATVRLASGHTYWISVPDGVQELARVGVAPASLHCSAAAAGEAPGALPITPQGADTKAVNQIASFVPGFSGTVTVACTGIGPVYVDDAADARFDISGFLLVVASVALAIGLPLFLSGLRSARLGEPVPAT